MPDEITMDEWFAELERLGVDTDNEGMTTRDLMSATGHGEHWVLRRLRQAMNMGCLVSGRATRQGIHGSMVRVPVYRFVRPNTDETKADA